MTFGMDGGMLPILLLGAGVFGFFLILGWYLYRWRELRTEQTARKESARARPADRPFPKTLGREATSPSTGAQPSRSVLPPVLNRLPEVRPAGEAPPPLNAPQASPELDYPDGKSLVEQINAAIGGTFSFPTEDFNPGPAEEPQRSDAAPSPVVLPRHSSERRQPVAASQPPPQPVIAPTILPEAAPSKQPVLPGKLVENIPTQMIVGERTPVEIRLGTADAVGIDVDLMGPGDKKVHALPVVETMRVQLFAPEGGFRIERTSPEEQLICRDVLKLTAYSQFAVSGFGQWIFYVIPTESGTRPLTLRISAAITGRGHAILPDKNIPIEVVVSYAREGAALGRQTLKLMMTGTVTGICGALAGGLTGKYWWPPIEGWLKARGWL